MNPASRPGRCHRRIIAGLRRPFPLAQRTALVFDLYAASVTVEDVGHRATLVCQLGRGLAQQDAAYERLAVLAMQAGFTLRPSLVGDGGRREKVFSPLIWRQVTPPRPPGFRHLPNVT